MLEVSSRLEEVDDLRWLKSKTRPKQAFDQEIRSVDLFSGCGGLSLGVEEAARRMGLGHSVEMASEIHPGIFEVFKKNFNPRLTLEGDILSHFDGSLEDTRLTENERALIEKNPDIQEVDILVGGPPCQGHSDLNNHSRREDSRNSLYFSMVRAARVLRPRTVIIENVQTVTRSKERVVQISEEVLESMGYKVDEAVLKAEEFGVPQLRRRHFLVASKAGKPDFSVLEGYKKMSHMTLKTALEGLGEIVEGDPFESPANSNDRNRERMQWLIDKDLYDLPNEERPPCHQNGHNYPAVYGRMRWDVPAHTITAGFGSNGQGRFQHPDRATTLTPHEAARVQTFPDWFDFSNHGHKRGVLSKSIGNAVPPLLAMYVAHVALLSIKG